MLANEVIQVTKEAGRQLAKEGHNFWRDPVEVSKAPNARDADL